VLDSDGEEEAVDREGAESNGSRRQQLEEGQAALLRLVSEDRGDGEGGMEVEGAQ